MKFFVTILISALTISAGATTTLQFPTFQPKPTHCLFFTIDGLDPAYITPEHTPTLYQCMQAGVALPSALNVYPTLTTPNMTSILTGALPIHTTIGSNQVYLEDERKVVAAPRFNKATTIAEAFKQGGHSTAAVQHFMLENRGADRYQHTGTKDSRDVTTTALAMLSDPANIPTFMAVLYQTVDGTGHSFGVNSDQVRAEARLVDGEIAKILNRYRELDLLQHTLIIFSADHGMSPPEKSVDQKTLNTAITSNGWSYQLLQNPRTRPQPDVDLYVMPYANLQCWFNRPFSPEEQHKLFATLRAVEGVGALHDTITLRRMGAHPNAGHFIVEPAHGWRFGTGIGTHGRNRESYGHQALLGAGVKSGVTVPDARTIDLMPTVLKAFNLPQPPTTDGKPLDAALIAP